MAIKTKRPPMKETVGARTSVLQKKQKRANSNGTYETDVEKTEVVKTVKVTVNADTGDSYASGKVYDSDTPTKSIDIETEVIAFPEDTLAKMKGDSVDARWSYFVWFE